jgi:hypothetical protein
MKPIKEWMLNDYYILGRFLLIMFLVAGAGVFMVNQALKFKYNAEFLKQPCGLCTELNPNQSGCLQGCFNVKQSFYPDGSGNWINDKRQKINELIYP